MSHIESQVLALLADRVPAGLEVTSTTDLIDAEVLDSLGIFTLVAQLEEAFGISVEAEEVTLDHFDSLSSIAALVTSKAGG